MPRFNEEFLQTLRDRTDIEELISGYVPLKKAGRLSKGLCPFHNEKTPSFTVYSDTQSFYCFGCQKGGDAVTFIRDIENLDYTEAVKFLADRAGLNMPEDDYDDTLAKKRRRMLEMNKAAARWFFKNLFLPSGKAGLEYWQNVRGLSDKTIRHFGLGFAPDDWHGLCNYMRGLGYSNEELFEANLARKSTKNDKVNYYDNFRNRAMVPIIDLRGNIIAFGGRVLDDSKPKYVNTSDTLIYKKSQAVFALNFAKSSGKDSLILCEGYMDVITLHQAGFTNAVAGLGTALTDEQVRLITRYCNEVMLSYDNDGAGREAMDKAIAKFRQTNVEIRSLNLQGGKDPDEIIKKFGAERFQSIIDGASNEIEYRLMERRVRYNIHTDDGRRRYLEDAAVVLGSLRNPVEIDIYASRLAEDTGVSKEAIMQQVKAVQRKRRKREERVDFGQLRHQFDGYTDPQNTDSIKVQRAEETLLTSLMANPDFFERVDRSIKTEDFTTDFHRHLYECLSGRLREHEPIDAIYFSAEFTPDEMGKFARLQTAAPLVSNTVHEVDDCIHILKANQAKAGQKDPSNMSDDEFRSLFHKKEN